MGLAEVVQRKQLGVVDGIARWAATPSNLSPEEANPVLHAVVNLLCRGREAPLERLPYEDQSLLYQIVELRFVAADVLLGEGLDEATVSRDLAVDVPQG